MKGPEVKVGNAVVVMVAALCLGFGKLVYASLLGPLWILGANSHWLPRGRKALNLEGGH